MPSQIFIRFLSSDSFYPRFFSLFPFIVQQQPCSSPTVLCTFVTTRITAGPCLCLTRGFQFPYITLSIRHFGDFWITRLCEFESSNQRLIRLRPAEFAVLILHHRWCWTRSTALGRTLIGYFIQAWTHLCYLEKTQTFIWNIAWKSRQSWTKDKSPNILEAKHD